MQIDRLPSHVIVIAATNHSELLDRAAWRRFQLRLELPAPTRAESVAFLDVLRERLGGDLGLASRTMADKLHNASYADLEQVALDIRRRSVLAMPDGISGLSHKRSLISGEHRSTTERRPSHSQLRPT